MAFEVSVIRLLLIFVMLAQLGVALQSSKQTAQRLPLQKREIVLKSPTNYAQRFLGIDPKTGKEIHYDPKPQVVLLDAKSGAYGLKWIGYDSKQKTIVYYRPDLIDVIISASVKRHSSGQYLYTYSVNNLRTSAQNVFGFAVQNFAADATPLRMPDVYVGHMSNTIREMNEGNWLDFAALGMRPGIPAGRSMEHQLLSSAPAGLVECRAVGITGMKGVGEEPPQELENVLPGYEAWPRGYTIGPVDELKSLPVNQRAKYLRKRLPQLQQLGWIVNGLVPWYEQNLRADNVGLAVKQATQDFEAGRITSELLGMIEFLR